MELGQRKGVGRGQGAPDWTSPPRDTRPSYGVGSTDLVFWTVKSSGRVILFTEGDRTRRTTREIPAIEKVRGVSGTGTLGTTGVNPLQLRGSP